MEVNVEVLADGFRIDDKFSYAVSEPVAESIALAKHIGEDVVQRNGRDYTLIDYPGEYEAEGFFVKTLVTGDLLHHIVESAEGTFAVVSDLKVLQDDDMAKIDTWLVTEQAIADEIEKLELEGSVVVLSSL